MSIWIGTSGWSYDHWQGILYPHGRPDQRLSFYVDAFDTVEINATYYRWPADRVFAGWRRRTPERFVITIKAPRGLTHRARLYAPEAWLARIAGGLAQLGPKLGVLLVQLPPSLADDQPRLAYFLAHVPRTIRVAVELRHPSWHNPATFALLEQFGAAYCVMSGAHLPCVLRATAPFVYVRLHGPDQDHMYGGSYSDDDLRWWADRIREWTDQGRDVYAYFNNDGAGNAVRNARRLRELLGV